MEMKQTYWVQPYLDGYKWEDDLLKQNPHSGKVTPIKRTKVALKNAESSGGVPHDFLKTNEGYTHRKVEANFWSEFIKILNPIFDAKINPFHLLETITKDSDLYNEEITNQIKEEILNFVNEYGFDFNNEVWTDDIEIRKEPTLQNICMEAFMLHTAVAMDMNDVLEDSAYKDKVNQSYLKVVLEDEGYNMFVLGFWDCVWRSFSLDPKRAYARLCVHCSKPFISASKKKKHCSDACKWHEWNKRNKAEKLGENK